MTPFALPDGIEYRPAWSLRARRLRFDDAPRLQGEVLVGPGGERVRLPPALRSTVAAVLEGPRREGSLEELGASFALYFRGPFGARQAA
ncbi:MAG: hypothetical protein ACYC8T_24845, partial [Myxococcaceae bacterium]